MKPNLARAIAALVEHQMTPYEFSYFDLTDNVQIEVSTCSDFVLLTKYFEIGPEDLYSSVRRNGPDGRDYNAFCGRFLRVLHQHSPVFPCWNGDPHPLADLLEDDASVTEPFQPSLLEGVS